MCLLWLLDTVAYKQGVDVGVLAAEAAVEFGGIFSASAHQYVAAEVVGCGFVEDTVLFEESERVGIEYLCPFVAVISCRIAS